MLCCHYITKYSPTHLNSSRTRIYQQCQLITIQWSLKWETLCFVLSPPAAPAQSYGKEELVLWSVFWFRPWFCELNHYNVTTNILKAETAWHQLVMRIDSTSPLTNHNGLQFLTHESCIPRLGWLGLAGGGQWRASSLSCIQGRLRGATTATG